MVRSELVQRLANENSDLTVHDIEAIVTTFSMKFFNASRVVDASSCGGLERFPLAGVTPAPGVIRAPAKGSM